MANRDATTRLTLLSVWAFSRGSAPENLLFVSAFATTGLVSLALLWLMARLPRWMAGPPVVPALETAGSCWIAQDGGDRDILGPWMVFANILVLLLGASMLPVWRRIRHAKSWVWFTRVLFGMTGLVSLLHACDLGACINLYGRAALVVLGFALPILPWLG